MRKHAGADLDGRREINTTIIVVLVCVTILSQTISYLQTSFDMFHYSDTDHEPTASFIILE